MPKTQLKTAQLGKTELEITRIGFGAWALGGGGWEFGWGPQEDEESIVGFRWPDQVDPVLAAAGLELSDDDVDEIEGRK
jgi:aryl-alcohol dehydrogenase-like predicted oxidoreductase